MAYQIGDLITFTYRGKKVNDANPKILVLHPEWRGVVHGLNFNYLTTQEQNYIKAVINPIFEAEIIKRDPRIAMQMQRIQTTLNDLHITSPHEFYIRFVRGFIQPRGWDPYRLYTPDAMYSPRVLTSKAVMVGDQKDTMFNRFAQKFQNMRGPQGPPVTLPNRGNALRPEPSLGDVQPQSTNTVSSLGKGGAKKLSDL